MYASNTLMDGCGNSSFAVAFPQYEWGTFRIWKQIRAIATPGPVGPQRPLMIAFPRLVNVDA